MVVRHLSLSGGGGGGGGGSIHNSPWFSKDEFIAIIL